jgi:hypothetical protein
MRISTFMLDGVLACATTMPAIGGSAYSKCAVVANPADRIARRAVASFGAARGAAARDARAMMHRVSN